MRSSASAVGKLYRGHEGTFLPRFSMIRMLQINRMLGTPGSPGRRRPCPESDPRSRIPSASPPPRSPRRTRLRRMRPPDPPAGIRGAGHCAPRRRRRRLLSGAPDESRRGEKHASVLPRVHQTEEDDGPGRVVPDVHRKAPDPLREDPVVVQELKEERRSGGEPPREPPKKGAKVLGIREVRHRVAETDRTAEAVRNERGDSPEIPLHEEGPPLDRPAGPLDLARRDVHAGDFESERSEEESVLAGAAPRSRIRRFGPLPRTSRRSGSSRRILSGQATRRRYPRRA